MKLSYIIMVGVLAPFLQPAHAYERYFRNYSVDEGIQSQVTDVLQDRHGYLWVATEGGGVSRFDGLELATFTVEDGLPSDTVRAVLEDDRGRLWFGTSDGVIVYEGDTFLPVEPATFSTGAVYALLQDRDGTVWIGTDNGVLAYDGTSLEPALGDIEALGRGVRVVYEDGSGRLWIGTHEGGLVVSSVDGTRVLDSTDGLPGELVYDVFEDRDGTLWVATDGGAARYEHDRFTLAAGSDHLARPVVRAITQTRDGTLWFATNGAGLCRHDGQDFDCITENDGLSSNFVWSLTEDREGNLWIGTYRGGLDRYSGERFVRFTTPDGFGDDVIRSILKDRRGNLWFGTFREGAAKWDGKKLTRYTKADGLISNFILTVYEDRDGNLWFGTFDGISKFDGRKFVSFDTDDGLPDPVVRTVYQDVDGDMWFGTNYGGLSVYDGRRFENFSESDGLAGDRVTVIVEAGDGALWAGSPDGVARFEDGRFSEYPSTLRFTDIIALVDDGRGYLWIAEYGRGVHRCPARNTAGPSSGCISFTSSDGLVDESVVSLTFDDAGHLWVGTESGVSRLDVPAFEASGQPLFHNYGADEGFVGIECVRTSILAEENGDVWFGTVAGAFRYRPGFDHQNDVEPLTRITNVRLFSDNVAKDTRGALPADLTFAHDENFLTFEFVGISLTAPSAVRYRFMLEGWDDTWSPPTEQRFATYKRIPPGRYSFQVKARNNDGVWNEQAVAYGFTIAPPFWSTPWFTTLVTLGLAVGLYGFVTLRVRHLEDQRQKLQQQVEESTRALRSEKDKVEKMNAELEARVDERTQELVKANQNLTSEIARREKLEGELIKTRKLESLGILAGGIAHDFNNFLTAVLGNISLAKHADRDPDRRSKLLSEAERASYRARDLTQQLLTFSKGGKPIKKVVALGELVEDATGFAIRGTNVTSAVDVQPDLWPIEADPGQITQVVHNLVLNAAQAMPAGGIVQVRCENARVAPDEVVQLPSGEYVVVTVTDDGHGIGEENLLQIFDPYFTTKEGGSGLGLASAYSIVRKHGGGIRVDARPGETTAFHVYLPKADKTSEQPEASRQPGGDGSVRKTVKRRILVMDDDEGVRQFAEACLTNLGHDVALATDGARAIELHHQAVRTGAPFDLVIMDLTVPAGKGGKQTAGELARLGSDVKIVVSSGYSNDPVMADYREHGFHDVLPKPFSPTELGAVIERVFD